MANVHFYSPQICEERNTVLGIAALNNDAIAVTRDGKIFFISATGTYNLLLQTTALGSPCSINSGSSVVVPDPDNQRLLIFSDDTGSFATWNTPDFSPAYAREFNNKLWVTGHDLIISLTKLH